jgi:hypothetical protein
MRAIKEREARGENEKRSETRGGKEGKEGREGREGKGRKGRKGREGSRSGQGRKGNRKRRYHRRDLSSSGCGCGDMRLIEV